MSRPIPDLNKAHDILSRYIDQQKSILNESLQAIQSSFTSVELSSQLTSYTIRNNVSLFIYKFDELYYWTDNTVPLPANVNDTLINREIAWLGNGLYILKHWTKDSLKVVLTNKIYDKYAYENEYLVNGFCTSDPYLTHIKVTTARNGNDFFDGTGKYIFSIYPDNVTLAGNRTSYLILIFFSLFLLSTMRIVNILLMSGKLLVNPILRLSVLIFISVMVRAAMIGFKWPTFIYEDYLFSPALLAVNQVFPSLGDTVLNVLLLLAVAWIFYNQHWNFIKKEVLRYEVRIFIFLGTGILFFTLFYYLDIFIRNIIYNSILVLDLNNIFKLSSSSLLGFIALASLVMTIFLFTQKLLLSQKSFLEAVKSEFYSIAIIFLSITIIISFYYVLPFWLIILIISLSYLLISSLLIVKYKRTFHIINVLIYLFFFSIIGSILLRKHLNNKERQQRILYAIDLASERDKIAEYNLSELVDRIIFDQNFNRLVSETEKDIVEEKALAEYINEKYLNRYLFRYDINIVVCNDFKELVIKPSNYVVNCKNYFSDYIKSFGVETNVKGLFKMFPGSGDINYLLELTGTEKIKIFVEIYSKPTLKGLGYPELLIDKKKFKPYDLSSYSYAFYRNGSLQKSFGSFPYHLDITALINPERGNTFFSSNGYNHLAYVGNNDHILLISLPEATILDVLASYSYLFIFFAFFIIVFSLAVSRPLKISISNLSLRDKILFSFISVLAISFLVIGGSTLFFIKQLNFEKNKSILSEKSHSVLIELEHKLADQPKLDREMAEYLESLLLKFSSVFFTDINLFDTQGKLLASSRNQVFEEGLISPYMNPLAYLQLTQDKKSSYVHRDRIGNYEFLSAYLPFRNNDNQLMGFLHLPYFAKQNELSSEISRFLSTFTNVYVILIALTLLLAVLLGDYLLRPLTLIRENLKQIRFGRKNNPIPWTSTDEIGQLITEYNRIIQELAVSAEMLARSEREKAWRDMAKQVAHEIKNPLTPMKLNIQHLLKSWNEKSPDWDEKINKFGKIMIQQIDALSDIAAAFSDFAAMPSINPEEIDLFQLMQDTVGLYSDMENISLEVTKNDINLPSVIVADKKQMLRVFNNLIRNAVQAIEPEKQGKISVGFSRSDTMLQVTISDNGRGIVIEDQERIFAPYFTTKSSGMGLGLTMVKNIISDMGGSISFESEPGKGTTFKLLLPLRQE